MSKSRATGRESFSVFVMSGQSWIIRNMKLALLAATLASVLFCGWSGPIDVGNALHPTLSHHQLKGIGRLLRVDPAVAVTDWECSTCKILFTELQNLFLKIATDENAVLLASLSSALKSRLKTSLSALQSSSSSR